jgi:hypothetical protein
VKLGMVNVSNGAINILVIAMNGLSILVFSNAAVDALLPLFHSLDVYESVRGPNIDSLVLPIAGAISVRQCRPYPCLKVASSRVILEHWQR